MFLFPLVAKEDVLETTLITTNKKRKIAIGGSKRMCYYTAITPSCHLLVTVSNAAIQHGDNNDDRYWYDTVYMYQLLVVPFPHAEKPGGHTMIHDT
jgi:hypothetical protein